MYLLHFCVGTGELFSVVMKTLMMHVMSQGTVSAVLTELFMLRVCRLSFGTVVGTMNKLANAMENGEFDFDGTHDKKVGQVAEPQL